MHGVCHPGRPAPAQPCEQRLHRARQQAHRLREVGGLVTEHGVRLARTGLAVADHGGIESVGDGIDHGPTHRLVHALLRDLWVEDAAKAEAVPCRRDALAVGAVL